MKRKPGKIIIPKDFVLTKAELEVIKLLEENYFRGECIIPVGLSGVHTPDLVLAGALWEIKSPRGNSRMTIERQFKRGKNNHETLSLMREEQK
jgi:hypothetical protein